MVVIDRPWRTSLYTVDDSSIEVFEVARARWFSPLIRIRRTGDRVGSVLRVDSFPREERPALLAAARSFERRTAAGV
jgi:hypothetical protein